MNTLSRSTRMCLVAAAGIFLAGKLQAQGWPEVFDPLTVISLNLDLDASDWETIMADETFKIKAPAALYADGETPLLVSVRRKSATPVGEKVSLKVDINDYVKGQVWHGVNKLSLENGDDTDVVSEGLAWYMHRMAAAAQPSGGTYMPGLAAWVTLRVNGVSYGVYLNVEEVNKQFLRNRSLWKNGSTWLYKQDDIGPSELKEGDPDSPTVTALNYSPFAVSSGGGGKGKLKSGSDVEPTPDDETLALELPALIDMQGMLTLGAVNAFSTNPDELFNKGKNFFWADFSAKRRLYFPWDLDAVIRGTNSNIYGQVSGGGKNQKFVQTPYQEVILNHPLFREQYNAIMLSLIAGPLSVDLLDFLDDLEPVLTPFLEADPDSKVAGGVAEHFDSLRAWIAERCASVLQQVSADQGL